MLLLGVFGRGGYGREVMPIAREHVAAQSDGGDAVFVDDAEPRTVVNGQRTLSFEEFIASPADRKEMVIAIGGSAIREKVADRCKSSGIAEGSLSASNAVIMDGVTIGPGAVISPFVTITSNVSIGRHFHANLYSYVAHDCVIGDFVTFAPQVQCNGNITIEDHAYVGTGAILKQGTSDRPLKIGRGAIVGMGAVVTKDVAAGETVVGNPARPLTRKKD